MVDLRRKHMIQCLINVTCLNSSYGTNKFIHFFVQIFSITLIVHLTRNQHFLIENIFQVKAINTKGYSSYSQEIGLATRVDRIPTPHRVAYDPSSQTLSLNIPATCLPLIAIVETNNVDTLPIPTWQVIDQLTLPVSGLVASYKEANLDQMTSRNYKAAGRSYVDEPIGVDDEYQTRVRVKLCLKTQPDYCGDYIDAECK